MGSFIMPDNVCYTLLTSLPHMHSLFDKPQQMLTRYQLDKRLLMLEIEQQAIVTEIEHLLLSNFLSENVDETQLIKQAQKTLMKYENEVFRNIAFWYLDTRTIIAAISRKNNNEKAPPVCWSFGSRYEYIRHHWNSPAFGLASNFPWISEFISKLDQHDIIGAEKLLMQATWKKLNVIAPIEQFTFEQVVIYILRWHLVNRWREYNGKKSLEIFKDAVDKQLASLGCVT